MATGIHENDRKNLSVNLPTVFRLLVAGLELIAVIVLAYICSNLFLFLLTGNNNINVADFVVEDFESPRLAAAAGDGNSYLKTVDAFFAGSLETLDTGVTDLPESTLDIQIFGIRAGANGDGTVILKSQGSVQKLAKVGDEIAPDTKLSAIFANRIEFRRNGRLETIYLDKERSRSLLVNDDVISPAGDSGLADAISRFIGALDLSPYRNGNSISGFTVGDNVAGAVLGLSGLEVGDIINSVNGNELHSWERVSEISEEFRSDKLDLQIVRRGEMISLSLSPSSLGQ